MFMNDYEVFRKLKYNRFLNNDKIFNISDYPYMDIVLGDHCNCKCRFCIADLVEKKICGDPDNIDRKVKYAIDNMGVKEVLILGGEPTISPILFDVIERLKKYNLNKICITTNGHRMSKDIEFARKLFASGITHLNLSLMNEFEGRQKYINQSKDYISTKDLEIFRKLSIENGVKIRINSNVWEGNNDNLVEILRFYEYVKPYCDSVKFSPLLKTDDFSVVNVVTEWVKDNILEDEEYDKLWHVVEGYFSSYPIVRNKETFGFVEYSMIIKDVPIILNYNQHGQLRNKVIKENKINNIKLLSTGELSLSWNREEKDYIINTK